MILLRCRISAHAQLLARDMAIQENIPSLRARRLMPLNPISFIFSLGKHNPLPLRPLIQLKGAVADPSALLPTLLKTPKSPAKIEQVQQSNQMSS